MEMEKMSPLENILSGQIVLLTGGGGGIGFEAAKAFAFMGARIFIAEIDEEKGLSAEQYLNNRYGSHCAEFYLIDLANEKEIMEMVAHLNSKYGCPHVVFNNAAITAMGQIEEVSSQIWDKSYAINFKASLVLTQLFLPTMKERNSGTIVFVSSSGAAPFMGAYEVFKTAQVELCNTLAAELEQSKVVTYTISPGLVKTVTAIEGIELVSRMMGISTEEFYMMNESHIISSEEAGWGFALSVVKATEYAGKEIGSIQVLMDFGFMDTDSDDEDPKQIDTEDLVQTILQITETYREQHAGWMGRNIFERQWLLRDFKKTVGLSADQFLSRMNQLETEVNRNDSPAASSYLDGFCKLQKYYQRQYSLLQGFEKNPTKLRKDSDTITRWIEDLSQVIERLQGR